MELTRKFDTADLKGYTLDTALPVEFELVKRGEEWVARMFLNGRLISNLGRFSTEGQATYVIHGMVRYIEGNGGCPVPQSI